MLTVGEWVDSKGLHRQAGPRDSEHRRAGPSREVYLWPNSAACSRARFPKSEQLLRHPGWTRWPACARLLSSVCLLSPAAPRPRHGNPIGR